MNIFNIIGPEMIGPSSSHTAGAVRLGNVAYEMMLGQKPLRIKIELSGSFGTTYKGHGTDKALIAGILDFKETAKGGLATSPTGLKLKERIFGPEK